VSARNTREPRFTLKGEASQLIPSGGFRLDDLMQKFSWRTMLIFVMSLLLAVILLGLATAYISKLKQQRRQLSDNSPFDCLTLEPRRPLPPIGSKLRRTI
jgi:hypothetical protein